MTVAVPHHLPSTPENEALLREMAACEQTAGQSVLAHGMSVGQKYRDILVGELDGWRPPSWLIEHRSALLEHQVPPATALTYLAYHDCGKPRCLVVGEDGKRRFPDHANVSADTWLSLGGDPVVGDLIRLDMHMHTLKGADLEAFGRSDDGRRYGPTLLLAALAEIHSNAEMFGGIESESFKIKWAGLDRRGKVLCRLWFSGDPS